MKDDDTTIIKMVIAVAALAIISITSCEIHRNHVAYTAIKQGADAEKAHCGIHGISSFNDCRRAILDKATTNGGSQ